MPSTILFTPATVSPIARGRPFAPWTAGAASASGGSGTCSPADHGRADVTDPGEKEADGNEEEHPARQEEQVRPHQEEKAAGRRIGQSPPLAPEVQHVKRKR